MTVFTRLTNLFPLWILLASLAALFHPPVFTWFRGPLITIGLGVIMLGMGVTMTVDDFKRVLDYPFWIFLGVFFQYLIMPSMGWFSAWLFKLPAPFAVGVILVACCPGGTASNVINYLAKADVPLSITMTTISTLVAVVMTPLLTTLLAGSRIHVDAMGLFLSTIQVVVMPVVLGVLINRFCPRVVEKVLPAAPFVAVLFIALIVGSIVGGGKEQIIEAGWRLIGAVFSLHFLGFLLGYLMSRAVTGHEITSRTISIEVGMQNSGLGVVLARKNFANPLVAIPSAISSVFHSVLGSLLAALWSRMLPKNQILRGVD